MWSSVTRGCQAHESLWSLRKAGDRRLEDGADTSLSAMSDKFGQTALHHAAFQGHADVVKLLLEAGADKEAKDM
eukprot:1339610-Rhodomonas_salina.1